MKTVHLSHVAMCSMLGVYCPSLTDLVGMSGNGWRVVAASFSGGVTHTYTLRPVDHERLD